MRKVILSVLMVLLGCAGLWSLRPRRHLDRQPPSSPAAASTVTNPASRDGQSGSVAAQSATALSRGVAAATAASPSATNTNIAFVMGQLKAQFGYAGALSWDDAKALIARREKAAQALEDQLAGLGSGGATHLGASYEQTEDMRGKLLLLRALGRIQDNQASGVIEQLLSEETAYSLQREMVVALGRRSDNSSTDALNRILAAQSDPQLRFAAAQALAGREAALPAMAGCVRSESNPGVQKELVLSIGAVGSPSARDVLADLAQSALAPAVREAAIQELGRNFGVQSLDVLERCLQDPNEAIRQNAVKAVARLQGEPANALLTRTAASDFSAKVRTSAQAALAARP